MTASAAGASALAQHVLLTNDWFWALFDEVCVEVLAVAERVEELPSKREGPR